MNQLLMIEEQAKELACGERPQARFENVGPEAMSDSELLALLLQGGMVVDPANFVAKYTEPQFGRGAAAGAEVVPRCPHCRSRSLSAG